MKFLLLTALLSAGSVFAGPREAYQELLEGKAVFLVVRENDEVKAVMIIGSMWVTLSDMEASTEATFSKVRDISTGKTIYVYCRSGRRSQIFLNHMSGAEL